MTKLYLHLYLQSDDWHADETIVFINSKVCHTRLITDSETRFILTFHLIKSRNADSAFTLINKAKNFGKPTNFVTDKLSSYNEAIAMVLPDSKHIPVDLITM